MTEQLNFPRSGPGEGGDARNGDNGFGKRLRQVEQEIAGMRADINNIKENMATKEDLANFKSDISSQIFSLFKWYVGVGIVLLASIIGTLLKIL